MLERQTKKCEVILQKVKMYKEKKNVEKYKKKDLKKDQNQNKKSFIWQEMIFGLITLKHDFGLIYPFLI